MGYRDPPKAGQIKPGEVRNAKGRPKGSKNRKTVVRDIASRHHYVTVDGERRRVTSLEALLLRLQFLAIEKGGKALKEHQRLVETYDIAAEEESKGYGVLLLPPEMTMEEAADIFGIEMTGRTPPSFLKVLHEVHASEETKSATEQK